MVAALSLALVPDLALAADARGGNAAVIGPNETIDDDLYVGGGTVTIHGTIRGDLVVSGGTVTVSGPVQGDVIAFGGTTTIQGPVGRNVRAAGGTITVSNTVARDVVVAGGNFILGPEAKVGRDLLAITGSAVVDGTITRNLQASSGDLILNGPVGGNVRFEGSTLTLGDRAAIGGDLTNASDNAVAPPTGVVKGQVVRQPRAAPAPSLGPLDLAAGIAFGWVRGVIGLSLLGLVLVLLFPTFSRRTRATLERSPLASFVVGLVTMIVVPVVAVLIFALGLLIGGWWLGFVTLATYGILLPVGMVVAALFVGSWIFARARNPDIHLAWALVLGVVVLLLAGLVPVVGGIAVLLALLFGIGALLLAGYQAYREPTIALKAVAVPESGPRRTAA